MKKIIRLLALLTAFGANTGNSEIVNAELRQALALNPDNEIYLLQSIVELENDGKYAESEPLIQRLLAIEEKESSKDDVYVVGTLIMLANNYEQQLKHEQAEPLFLRSLAIKEKALGNSHLDVADILDHLASFYDTNSKHEQAEPLLERSLAIKEKALGKNHMDVLTSLKSLAVTYGIQAKFEQAEPLFLRVLAIREKTLDKDHPLVAASLEDLAGIYEFQGKHEQAESLYLKSLAIRKKIVGKSPPDYSGDLTSFNLWLDGPANLATSLDKLAQVYQAQGKDRKAETLYLRSLEWREGRGNSKTDHLGVASSLSGLADIYRKQGKYEVAESLYKRSLAIEEKAYGKDSVLIRNLNGLALLYQEQGKYEQAESLFIHNLATIEQILGNDDYLVTVPLINLAVFYQTKGNYEKAEPLHQRNLRIMNQALQHWLWGAGEKTRQSYLQQQESMRNTYLSFYSLRNTSEEAFYFSLSRKGLLLRIASEVSALAKQSADPAIQKPKQQFNALRAQLSNLLFSGKANKAEIQALEEKSENLERQLSQSLSGFKLSNTEITPKEVLEKLNPDQSLIDFLVYKEVDLKTLKNKTEQVIALITDKQNGVKLIKLGELAPIAAAIKTYQDNIVPSKDNTNSREQTLTQTAQTLYIQLWQPLTPYLQNKKTVYLIPDGDLHLLPFKALQDKDGKYLAEKWQLITLSSARDIVLPPLEGKATAAAIFASPDYGDDKAVIKSGNTAGASELKNIHFSSLPNALNEGQQIYKLFIKKQPNPRAKLLLKAQATEQAVTALTSPKILHLSTHGFFLEDSKPDEIAFEQGLMRGLYQPMPFTKIENPLTRSGLAFVGANLGVKGITQADGTDGVLTALEVLNLNLEGTDLVTLSACDTGKGDVKIGEGVYSLNRAFQEAGAKAVLSTLWSVDDKATGEFMQKFYNRFLDGKPPQQAIQETQIEFMQDKQYSNPFYWAGFVMMGKD